MTEFLWGLLLYLVPGLAWAQNAVVETSPATMTTVWINIASSLPATIGAIGALIVAWRTSSKSDRIEKKTDTVAAATVAVAAVAEKINQAALDAKYAALEANLTAKQGIVETTQVVTSAAEDVRAHAVVVQEIKDHVVVHSDGLKGLLLKVSTVAEDIKRSGEATGEIKGAFSDSLKTISTIAEDVGRMNDAVTEIKTAISKGTAEVKEDVKSKTRRK